MYFVNRRHYHFDGLDDARGSGEKAPPEARAHPAEPAALEAVFARAGLLAVVGPPPSHHLPDHDRAPTHLEVSRKGRELSMHFKPKAR